MKSAVLREKPGCRGEAEKRAPLTAGLGHETKPVGSFLFSGPTGVGKTEVSKQLAQILGVVTILALLSALVLMALVPALVILAYDEWLARDRGFAALGDVTTRVLAGMQRVHGGTVGDEDGGKHVS